MNSRSSAKTAEIPCETKLAVLATDEFRGSVGVFRDVTERKRRERRLSQQNDRLDAFASIVSHDLRNPLSVAKGCAEIIDVGDTPEEFEAITESLDRMESIITDVLTIARDGTGSTRRRPTISRASSGLPGRTSRPTRLR